MEKHGDWRCYTATQIVDLLRRAGLHFQGAYKGLSKILFRAEGPEVGDRLTVVAAREDWPRSRQGPPISTSSRYRNNADPDFGKLFLSQTLANDLEKRLPEDQKICWRGSTNFRRFAQSCR